MAEATIAVEVFLRAEDGTDRLLPLRLPAGATVADAVRAAGLRWPAHDLRAAVFGVLKDDDDPVLDGDRIDLTRPLLVDPKQARRLRARARG